MIPTILHTYLPMHGTYSVLRMDMGGYGGLHPWLATGRTAVFQRLGLKLRPLLRLTQSAFMHKSPHQTDFNGKAEHAFWGIE